MNQEKCPECGSNDARKHGFKITRKGKTQQHQCKNCGRVFS